jgi:hypothetical protein
MCQKCLDSAIGQIRAAELNAALTALENAEDEARRGKYTGSFDGFKERVKTAMQALTDLHQSLKNDQVEAEKEDKC